ncbi:MAG: GHMP kinase [Chloroflexi bacterium]|nr:GHMP kinase [Chloroflexota bacterium]
MSDNGGKFVRARAPLRISFVGGGTDLPAYYTRFGGAVLAGTVNRYTYVTLAPREDDYVSISSLDFDVTVKYHVDEEPIYNDALKLAQAAVRRLVPRHSNSHGFDLYIQSDAPAGSGLGGSTALVLAILGAIMKFKGIVLDNQTLAELAYTIERFDLGISGGKQDQYQVTFGGFNLIEFNREAVSVNPLAVSRVILNDLEHHLLICYTGKTHTSAQITDKLDDYVRSERPATIEGLRLLRGLVYDLKDALLEGRLLDAAYMLDCAWQLKLKLNPPEVTDPFINDLYEEARKSGALGGKLLGAGGGGFLLLFCESSKKRAVRERLEAMGCQFAPFSFVEEGLGAWWSNQL